MADQWILEFLLKAQNQANQAFDQARKGLSGMLDSAKQAAKGWTDLTFAANAAGQVLNLGREIIEETVGTTMEYAEQVRNLSRLIGASSEESSKLIQAADDVKVEYSALTTGLQVAIRNGVQPNIEGIARLADRYVAIQNPIDRTEFLLKTFGRSGAQLGPLMEIGAQGIRELGEEAEKAGLVLGQADVDATRKLEVQIDNLNDKLEAAKLKIGLEVVPVANSLLGVMLGGSEAVNEANLSWTRFIPLLGGLTAIFAGLKSEIEGVTEETKNATAATKDYANTSGPIFGNRGMLNQRAGYGNYYTGTYNAPEPGRASGGPVWAGITRMVGESGPEPFTPNVDGWIGTPPGGSGGGNLVLQLSFPSMFPPSDPGQLERVLRPVAEQVFRDMKTYGRV